MMGLPVAASHTRAVLSKLAVTTRVPSASPALPSNHMGLPRPRGALHPGPGRREPPRAGVRRRDAVNEAPPARASIERATLALAAALREWSGVIMRETTRERGITRRV